MAAIEQLLVISIRFKNVAHQKSQWFNDATVLKETVCESHGESQKVASFLMKKAIIRKAIKLVHDTRWQ